MVTITSVFSKFPQFTSAGDKKFPKNFDRDQSFMFDLLISHVLAFYQGTFILGYHEIV